MLKYVTSVDNEHKFAYWNSDDYAVKFSLDGAKTMVECLCINGFRAILVQMPQGSAPFNGQPKHIKNPIDN